jgi:predicted nucleotidyltransferase
VDNDVVTGTRAADQVALRFPALSLIVLFGSRARGDAHPASDWDIAYSTTQPVDALTLRASLVDALGSDRIDLVDLDRASALLRFRVAGEGIPLLAHPQGAFERFWLDAVRLWCDIEPVVRAGYATIVADLER